ncbi:50S ribosomal protein L30e-like protein [Vararia minispora EC-137]|uniref:50S ribosomal protein L30e-like protein n=1 Tax=Vararia minispora EC-137 TaxID=1314806 RepID=A0ACB8QZX6_9AGAM|nr:50S ribosomal protein L30e-like protein [Vararia minispora EC-137]
MGKENSEKKRKSVAVEDEVMAEASPSKKEKKAKKDDEIIVPVSELSPIAHPLAREKLAKKLHKTIKKASKQRQVKRGVKEVAKGIRKGEKGLLILAADITPVDIISHLPILSEEAGIPYVFVHSKEKLGEASSTKRPTSCVMVCPNQKRKKADSDGKEDDYKEAYDECCKEVLKLDQKLMYQ